MAAPAPKVEIAPQRRSGRLPVVRGGEGRQRHGRLRLLTRRRDQIGRDAVPGAEPAIAVADKRLFEFDYLLMLHRATDRGGRELALAELANDKIGRAS